MPSSVTLTLTWEEGSETSTCSLAAFLRANRDAPELCNAVAALAPGESLSEGGGAAPFVTITRHEDP